MKQWFVVQSKLRQEAVAEVNLKRQGFETYWPRIVQNRRFRGKWRKAIEPLFPRYLFVCLEQGRDDFAPIRSTIGVKELVCFGGVPKFLKPEIIEEIKSRETDEQGTIIGSPAWKTGDEVRIIDGAMAGSRAIFLAQSGKDRVLILLGMLGQEQKVSVSPDALVPA